MCHNSLIAKRDYGRGFSFKTNPDKWGKKEILGHLIDSATNNHQRFVRIQFEHLPVISYNQNQWNDKNHYHSLSKEHLIQFWTIYNSHLLEIIKLIPQDNLSKQGFTGGNIPVTLSWLINDYVSHTEHHLKQLVDY